MTDSAANIKKAVTDTFRRDNHMSYFAHLINLVAEDAMKFEGAISLCTKI